MKTILTTFGVSGTDCNFAEDELLSIFEADYTNQVFAEESSDHLRRATTQKQTPVKNTVYPLVTPDNLPQLTQINKSQRYFTKPNEAN